MYEIPNLENTSNKQIIDYLNSIEITSCLNPIYVKDEVYGIIIALLTERNSLKSQLSKSHEQRLN
jgi:hypothetical protein